MLNIFSTEEKKKVIAEYRLRLGIIAVFAVAALVLSSLVLLVPSYLIAVSKYNNVLGELSSLELRQDRADQEKEVGAQIRDENKKIDIFLKGDTSGRPTPPQTILNIIGIKSDAIKIQGFTYDASAGAERLVVTGVASDRDGLAGFVEILKKNPTFTKVELPISSYVKSTDIDFSVVVERVGKGVAVKK